MSTKPTPALSQIKLSLHHLKTRLWSTVVHVRVVRSWQQGFWVASDESRVVWSLFNMTHILQTNSNTAGPVVPSKNIQPLKTWLTRLDHVLLCVMEMFKKCCLPAPSWSAFSGRHREKNSPNDNGGQRCCGGRVCATTDATAQPARPPSGHS